MGFKTLNQVDVTDGTVKLVDGTSSYIFLSSNTILPTASRRPVSFPNFTQTTIAIYILENRTSSSCRNHRQIQMTHYFGHNGRKCWRLELSACSRF